MGALASTAMTALLRLAAATKGSRKPEDGSSGALERRSSVALLVVSTADHAGQEKLARRRRP
eukprot:1597259-Pyramimonas_sp.AAC.1